MSIEVHIHRTPSGDTGTFGTLTIPSLDWTCHTLECPWRDNHSQVSCIPPGTYQVQIVQSPKFGHIYGVQDVPGRANILIHSGNFGGDTSKGFHSDIEGCILLGLSTGVLEGQPAILSSRNALTKFMQLLGDQPFTLVIE
jgi:hypothetical protein